VDGGEIVEEGLVDRRRVDEGWVGGAMDKWLQGNGWME
jgi:hypothetical protein